MQVRVHSDYIVVEIAKPDFLFGSEGRDFIVSLLDDRGNRYETYLAESQECALKIAVLLFNKQPIPDGCLKLDGNTTAIIAT